MFIRRLNVTEDLELFRQIYEWEKDYPRWLQDAEKVARLEFDKFIGQAKDRADVGVFSPEFTALFSILRRAPFIFEVHIWAKRKTNLEVLGTAALNLRSSLENELGMKAIFAWIVERNRAVRRLCKAAGLEPDGGALIDGESHGKPIKWVRLSYGSQKNRNEAEREHQRLAELQFQ